MKEDNTQTAMVDSQAQQNQPTHNDVKRWMCGSPSKQQVQQNTKNNNIALKAFRASVAHDKSDFDERADELAKGMMSSVLK